MGVDVFIAILFIYSFAFGPSGRPVPTNKGYGFSPPPGYLPPLLIRGAQARAASNDLNKPHGYANGEDKLRKGAVEAF